MKDAFAVQLNGLAMTRLNVQPSKGNVAGVEQLQLGVHDFGSGEGATPIAVHAQLEVGRLEGEGDIFDGDRTFA